MKRLEDMDFSKTYGDVPESFSHRVQYALRRMEEEKTVKKATFRTMAIVLVLTLLAVSALAAVATNTLDFFGSFYGESKREMLSQGEMAKGGQSHRVGDLVYTMGDVVAGSETIKSSHEDGTAYTYETTTLYGTGVISAAEGANVVLMAMDDYTLDAPWGCDLYGLGEQPAEGTLTYAQKAEATGAAIRRVGAIPNGLVDVDGAFIPASVGYALMPQHDGTVMFSLEIIPDAPLEKQAQYTLSMWLGSDAIDEHGSIVEGSRQAEDWVVEIKPQAEKPAARAGGCRS